jgi:serine/threonine-protein kinase
VQIEQGTRVGSYEILAAIGAGGMGVVYRARDTKLDRDVAIKVLPDLFAGDPERLRRFEREAKTLASLNHPNIAQVHGVIDLPGTLPGRSVGLVMEFVDGEDLAARLERGRLSVDDALAIGGQIAEALEEAHEKGIVHRDLKPGNVRVSSNGRVKVLDFGLAKAYQEEAASAGSDPSASPTMTVRSTEAGMILGTAAYMSPEQARGKALDRRADIWAFGAVLFELLTGKRLFAGDTVTDTLASVLRTEPDWSALPAATPPSVRRLLRRCLDRDMRRRLQSIGEARIVLSEPSDPELVPASATPQRYSLTRILPWALAVAAFATAFAIWLARSGPTSGTQSREVTYVDVSFPPDIEPVPTLEAGFNISPDGRLVVATGVREGARRLHVRALSTDSSIEITDSSGVTGSVFSPDSLSLAFLANTGLVIKVSLADQQRSVLARGADLAGGIAWGPAGVVIARNGALWLVPTDGGKERQLTTLDAGRKEVLHTNPALPSNGRHVLFTSLGSEPGAERIEAVPLEGGTRIVVLERATTPVWSPTGDLLFARDGGVFATRFDVRTLKTAGAATAVIPKGVVGPTTAGGLGFRVSLNGDLLLLPNHYHTKRVEAVGRDGASIRLNFPAARYMNPRVSPDGRRVLADVAGYRLDVLDLERQTLSRMTPEAPGISFGIWSRDSRYVIFRRYSAPYWVSADGSGEQQTVPSGTTNDFPSGAGPDPDSFFSTRITPEAAGDVVLVSRTRPEAPRVIIKTASYEGGAQLSPDGRWLVYVSTESGQSEIQVRQYPSLDRKWQVSDGFGLQPRWRADGREIFLRDGRSLIGVPFDGSKNEPVIGKPAALFPDEFDLGQGVTIANYDVMKDGRFVMLRRDGRGVGLRLVQNWTQDLTRIIAQGGVR